MKIDPTGHPMMSQEEVAIIDELIEERKPKVCLEWGSGNSTIYFPKKHECIKSWVSIEDLGGYVKYLSPKMDREKVTLMWVPDNEWYIDCVKHQGKKYDFILVDGVDGHREACLDLAITELAKKGAMVLLHDSGREEYQPFIKRHRKKAQKLSEGEKKIGEYYAHRGLTLFKV